MFRSSIEKKLTNISTQMRSLTQEIAVLREQIDYSQDEAEDSRIRALVSETPLAGEEARRSSGSVSALKKDMDVKAAKLAKLELRQDELLDQLTQNT